MKRKISTLMVSGLAAFLATRVVSADIGGGGSYTRTYNKVENTAVLVNNIQDKNVREEVLVQLFYKGAINKSDPILGEVLGYLETRNDFEKAAHLAKNLGEKDRADTLYTKYLDAARSRILEDKNQNHYSRLDGFKGLGYSAKEFGLENKAKELFQLAVQAAIATGDIEKAGDIYKNNLEEKEKADNLYKQALTKTIETERLDDDAQIQMKLGNIMEADKLYANEIKRLEGACSYENIPFYAIADQYDNRADIAEKKGDLSSKASFEEKASSFRELSRYDIKCKK